MVPPRSPCASRVSSSLPFTHSVIRPTIGSAVGPNSVELALSRRRRGCAPPRSPPSACRSRCRRYGTLRVRAKRDGVDLALGAALAEAARHQDAVDPLEIRRRILLLEDLALDPVEVDLHLVGDAAVRGAPRSATCRRPSGPVYLPTIGDRHLAFRMPQDAADLAPAVEVRRRRMLLPKAASTSPSSPSS